MTKEAQETKEGFEKLAKWFRENKKSAYIGKRLYRVIFPESEYDSLIELFDRLSKCEALLSTIGLSVKE